ncbi:MAG: phosphopantetheine-binding protein, partial [Gemmatimonadota bacterium]
DMIGRRSGLDSFDATLHAESRTLLVGLDVRRPNVSRYLTGAPHGLQELVAFHTTPSDPAALASLHVLDVAGRPTRCSFVPVVEMPLDEAGAVDLSRLDAVCRSRSPQAVLPRTSAERTVAAIWQEILEIDRIDIDANFFSLGGQSILLLQVLERLEKSFGRRIAVVDLFRYPTVRSLADFLGGSGAEKRSYEEAADRARKQRTARRARSRARGPR